MSRNLTFFIIGLTSAVLAYILSPSVPALVDLAISERLPWAFTSMLQNSDIVAFAGLMSLFGFLFILFYLIFPVSYAWYHIDAARRIVAELPLSSNPTRRTDKKTFLSQLENLGFINRLAAAYSPYLIQGPEEEVSEEALKKAIFLKRATGSDKNRKFKIAPVTATAPGEVVFNGENIVDDNLFLGFFHIFARLLVGIGVICFGASMVSFSLGQEARGDPFFSAAQPGVVALLYCLTTAVIMAGASHLVELVLSQNTRALARGINGLFHQNGWQQDLAKLREHLADNPMPEQLEAILQRSLNQPMNEISKAVKALSVEQEKKLNNILSQTLDSFARDLEEKAGKETESLNKALKDVARAATQMKKKLIESSSKFSEHIDKQASAIASHLTDMQKVLKDSERTTQEGTERIISTMAEEVEGAHQRFGAFMETSLKKLEQRQAAVETAVNDKDGILNDLNNTAKDLGTISNASGKLLERFISLSAELDVVLGHIQQNGSGQSQDSDEKREKFRLALKQLRKANSDRLGELPDI